MQQQRRIGPQQGYNNQGAGGYQQGYQQQNQGSKARFTNPMIHPNAIHSVPESLYSFRFRFSPISVFYNRKFKKNCEIAEFIPNQLRFHEIFLANFHDMEISLVVLTCHFLG